MKGGSGTIEHLRRFMSPRHHVAGRAELLAQGFRASRIRSWLRQGRLIGVIHGVYAFGRDIETREAAWRAALVAAGPGSVLAGRSACESWGLTRNDTIPRTIEVIRRSTKTVVLRGVSPAMSRVRVRIRGAELDRNEIRQKDGLPLTSPARSLIDLAADATQIQVTFAFLEACRLHLFGRKDVEYCFRRLERRRGAEKLRSLLPLWVPELRRIRSVLEGLFLLAWVKAGYRVPRVNEKVHGYEVDFYWPEYGIVLEVDGRAFHSDPIARKRDEAKTRALEAHGLRAIRVTYREMKDNPQVVVAGIAAMMA